MTQSANGENSSMQQEKSIPLTHGDIPTIVETVAKSMQRSPVLENGALRIRGMNATSLPRFVGQYNNKAASPLFSLSSCGESLINQLCVRN